MAREFFERLKMSRQSGWYQAMVPGGSIALCCAVAFIFWFQPDPCAAILVLPRWLWIVPGLALAFLGWTRQRKRLATAAVVLWMLYTVFFVQELRSLVRWRPGAATDEASLCVISLNCNAANESAAAEVKQFHPNLVLFEETPSRLAVQKMATNLLGADAETLCSSDVSLVARGKVVPVPTENRESAPFIHARIEFPSGLAIEVIALRLQPYNIRADLWSPECWRNQYGIRRKQREQFRWIRRELDKIPSDVPVILGGDFNLPAGDRLFGILQPRLRDTFREAGHGWGDTLDNNVPVLRIDQIWCDKHFRPLSIQARRTVNSDHRMVICDVSCALPAKMESTNKAATARSEE